MRSQTKCLMISGALALAMATPGAVAAAAAPSDQVHAAFRVLREPTTPNVPTGVRWFISSSAGRAAGLDASNVHRVAAPGGGFWDVLPGEGQLCLYIESDQVGSCVSDQQALAGYLQVISKPFADQPPLAAPVTVADGPEEHRGIAPDGVTSVAPVATVAAGDAAEPTADGLFSVASRVTVKTLVLHRARAVSLKVFRRWHGPRLTIARRVVARAAAFDYIPSANHVISNIWIYQPGWSVGNWHNITAVGIAVYNGQGELCENAQNSDGSLAGVGQCTYGSLSHAYNGSYRRGLAQGAVADTWGTATETY
jgi:hypothetical protein